jgi:hypothetical protein
MKDSKLFPLVLARVQGVAFISRCMGKPN